MTRVRSGEASHLVTLSDSTELACQGVLFGDGEDSQIKSFWDKPAVPSHAGQEVRCWSFSAQNIIGVKSWEYRWAPGKSVELLPLPQERLSVRLRFKSRYGGELSVIELRELYSEFGSDMTALLESPDLDNISCRLEKPVDAPSFFPAPGCFALGRAAWSPGTFLASSWLERFVEQQLATVLDQGQNPKLLGESFEAQSREFLEELSQKSKFATQQLHLDNALIRSLRGALLTLLPSSFVARKLKARLKL